MVARHLAEAMLQNVSGYGVGVIASEVPQTRFWLRRRNERLQCYNRESLNRVANQWNDFGAMAADPIIYCLQELTDYDAFERLCSDVMAGLEYRDIEPLGGRSDRGRDAIFVSRANPQDVRIFAYTVRSDWKKKLREDCASIQKNGHDCRRLVFVCTSDLTSNDKDAAKDRVGNEYGWDLNIYDLERLRISLVGPLRHLVPQHPQIFRDPWFPKRGGISIAHGRDTIVIDHVSADHAFATWLARKLQLDGYATWCYGTAPMAGETPDDTVRALIEYRAVRYLPILSKAALECPDLVGRCVLAGSHDELVVPCIVGSCDTLRLGSKLQTILPIRFDSGWAGGVRELILTLEARDVEKHFDTHRGQAIALKSFVPEPVTIQQTEQLIASVFPITSVPDTVLVFQTRESLNPDQIQDARKTWAFAELASGLFASFHVPPQELNSWQMSKKRESLWRHIDQIERRYSSHVAKELLRRCLELACYDAGLVWCDDRKLLYSPPTVIRSGEFPTQTLKGSGRM